MKIGIMTFHASYNCGSMLQAFALQQTLIQKYGAEVEIIDYSNWHQRNMYSVFDKRPNKTALTYDLTILPHVATIQSMRRDYQKFMRDHFVLSPQKYYWHHQLAGVEKNYDMLVAGGDQVWNIRCRDHDDAYYLDFAKNVRKVAYSPSLGGQNLLKYAENPDLYKKYIEDFECVSVRERNSKIWLEKLTGREIPIIADPTLLLTKDEWSQWLPLEDILGDYIFNYSYYHNRPETNNAIAKIGKMLNMPIYTIDYKSSCLYKLDQFGIKKYPVSGPIGMLSLMKNAKLVLTQSFHGTLFAALFGKTFWSYNIPKVWNPDDDRAEFILEQFGLSDRYVVIDTLPDRGDLMDDIDYIPVQEKIDTLRLNGLKYIDGFMKKDKKR